MRFAAATAGCAANPGKEGVTAAPAKVYMTRDISPAGLKAVYEALGRPEDIRESMKLIRCNRVVISLFETDRNDNNYHWRYRPEMDQQHHRELFISNFVRDSKHYGVFTETNADRFDASKLTFPGRNLFNYATPAAYPLPLIGRTAAITSILDRYREKHLFGIGRWGEHQHHNHDVCIKHALDFVASL